ncbi:MAG TPA: cell envelope integrity protein CreD [bacterium]|nr:cell envelope integrity protein CreD [bacterium]
METIVKSESTLELFFQRQAMTFKLAWIAFLVLVLLIPVGMVKSLLHERTGRRDAAVSEMTFSWAGEQTIAGPVLVIPYRYVVKNWKEETVNGKPERFEVEETLTAEAFFLPDSMSIEGSIEPSLLHRGIYDAVVYNGALEISGQFSPPDFTELDIDPVNVLWDKSSVTFAIQDLRGAAEMLTVTIGDTPYEFKPGSKLTGYSSGIIARLPNLSRDSVSDYRMHLEIKGSRGIYFTPVGKQNRVKLSSPWTAPSFQGSYLPTTRGVTDDGFEALWEVSWYGRGYPQQSTNRDSSCALNADRLSGSRFGVNFIVPLDSYRMVERSIKYAALFIILVFAAFFIFESFYQLKIHTIQYTLIGVALCLFFLAVLSLSEFFHFFYAYWTGALASALLVILYSLSVLKRAVRAATVGVILLATYTYLYVILQLQDYSLLFGTVGLFAALAVVMYVTNKMDAVKRMP